MSLGTVASIDPPAVAWVDGAIEIIDQTQLPEALIVRRLTTVGEVVEAVQALRVRGAPAIGACGALGLWLALHNGEVDPGLPRPVLTGALDEMAGRLASARPTAVNLSWAIEGCLSAILAAEDGDRVAAASRYAMGVLEKDRRSCTAMARHGADLLVGIRRVLTHCNTGSLATCGVGTALGVILELFQRRGLEEVLACETRPLLQGSRLTAWELLRAGVPARILTDSMAPWALHLGMAEAVLVGADRIAANGDTANKIGTYALALAAAAHDIPFYVVAPLSTVDVTMVDGAAIPIEERTADEVLSVAGHQIAPHGVRAWNPAFDVTPADLITAIVTEAGVVRPPFGEVLVHAVATSNSIRSGSSRC